MRIFALAPLALLAACQVSEGDNSVTVSYNQDVAENAIDDAASGLQEAGEAIANSAEAAKDKVENTDVDITVTNEAAQ